MAGVRWVEDLQTDVLTVTLQKSERHYSPTTQYRDYAISPELFHWETQNITSTSSPTGQRYLLTVEGYYIQKLDRQSNTQAWKVMTPDEDRRVAINPSGGYIYTVAQGNRIEFRDINGKMIQQLSTLRNGTRFNYPYGIRVITYSG